MTDHRMTEEELTALVRAAVRDGVDDALTRLGVDSSNPIAMQRDFQAIRQWREASEAIRRRGIMALVGVLVTGVAGVLWLGVRSWLAAHGLHADQTLP